MKKVIDKIITVFETIVTIFLVLLIIVTGVQRFSNSGSFFGYRIYTVASSSMIPIYTIGDTLLIEDTSSDNIHVGDALTYRGEEGELKGMIITHQVVNIEEDIDGKKMFHTKGVANDIEDPIVSEDQVFGKVIYKFYTLSFIGKITQNMVSLLICIVVPVAILIAGELFRSFKSKLDEEDDNLIDKIEDVDDTSVNDEKDIEDKLK